MTEEPIMFLRARDNLFVKIGLPFGVVWRFVVHCATDEQKTGRAKVGTTMMQVVKKPIIEQLSDEPTQT